MTEAERPSRSLCWDEEKELVALLLFPEREVLLKITSYSPRELEGLLTRELYENVKGCNF